MAQSVCVWGQIVPRGTLFGKVCVWGLVRGTPNPYFQGYFRHSKPLKYIPITKSIE